MRVKVIKACWYNERYFDPELSSGDIIIDFAGKKLPSWAEEVKAAPKVEAKKPEENKGESVKVNELPLVEKNALLEEAKAVGIEGNQIGSWKVETLKAKIEAAKAEAEGEEDEGSEE